MNETKNWYDAESFCVNIGGHLSSFDSYNNLLDVIRSQYPQYYLNKEIWIGLNQIDKDTGCFLFHNFI